MKIPSYVFSFISMSNVLRSYNHFRREAVKDIITNTVDEHIRALEEKKRRLIENLDAIFQGKEKVSSYLWNFYIRSHLQRFSVQAEAVSKFDLFNL